MQRGGAHREEFMELRLWKLQVLMMTKSEVHKMKSLG